MSVFILDWVRIYVGMVMCDEVLQEVMDIFVVVGVVILVYVDVMWQCEEMVFIYMGNGFVIFYGINDVKDVIFVFVFFVVCYDGGVDWVGELVNFVIGIVGVGDEYLEILLCIVLLFFEEDDVVWFVVVQIFEELYVLLLEVNER